MWWAASVCAVAICGCSEPPLLAETRDIELSGWESAESAVFHWDIQDTLQRHDVLLDVRHSQTYPYSNLYVFLTYRFPNGKSRVDTVECTLADERGRWRGSGFGDLVDQRFMLNQGDHRVIVRPPDLNAVDTAFDLFSCVLQGGSDRCPFEQG